MEWNKYDLSQNLLYKLGMLVRTVVLRIQGNYPLLTLLKQQACVHRQMQEFACCFHDIQMPNEQKDDRFLREEQVKT